MTAVAELLAHVPRLFVWVLSKRTLRNREREVFLRVIRPGMTVLDVGANVGDYTRLFSVLVGRRGAVHAFEPVPHTHSILTRAVSDRANVDVHLVALGDSAVTRDMTVVAGDYGQASLVAQDYSDDRDPALRETFHVQVVTLDAFMASRSTTPPCLIKIDVEGAERMVLEGARTLIAAHLPILYFEVFDRWTRRFGYTPVELLRAVEALGYTECYLLDSTLRRLTLSSATLRWPAAGSANVIALPPTPFGALTRRRLAPLLAETRAMAE